MLYTPNHLATYMGQSIRTARRVLREVFPHREEPTDWRLSESEWSQVLNYLASRKRRFGCRRRRHHA